MATKLMVRPNPFAAFDHKGNLCGAVACDAADHVRYADPHSGIREKNRRWEARRYVGARIDAEKTVARQNEDFLPNGDQDTVWIFDTDTDVELPVTEHYKQLVRTGGLLAANVETAVECGISEQDYLSPRAILDASKAALIDEWKTHYGDANLPDWAKPLVSLVKSAPNDATEAPIAVVKHLKKVSA